MSNVEEDAATTFTDWANPDELVEVSVSYGWDDRPLLMLKGATANGTGLFALTLDAPGDVGRFLDVVTEACEMFPGVKS
jgi:hypothetical protein